MTNKNVIAFCLGLLAAGLLWQYYLKPKYLLKTGDEETLAAIHRTDIETLNKATQEVGGEVLFEDYGDAVEDDISKRINEGTSVEDEFEFHSTANRQEDIFEQAARPKKKRADIRIEAEDAVMYPSAIKQAGSAEELDLSSERISMIVAPAKAVIISNHKEYVEYQKANSGKYDTVDFSQHRIVFVESASVLSNGFFEIKNYEEQPDKITVFYKVNILGVSDRPEQPSSILVPAGTKPVEIKQVK